MHKILKKIARSLSFLFNAHLKSKPGDEKLAFIEKRKKYIKMKSKGEERESFIEFL